MTKTQNPKPVYDLKERTFQFAKAVRLFVKNIAENNCKYPCPPPARSCLALAGGEDGKQLIKASGSVGAKLQTCFGH
jgi:hypothetical protein